MLDYLGMNDYAKKIEAATLKVLEEGIHTGDLYREGFSKKKVGTKEFTQAVIDNMGKEPTHIKIRDRKTNPINITLKERAKRKKDLVGTDLFIDWDSNDRDPNVIGDALAQAAKQTKNMKLKMITNRGVKVYPGGFPETFKTDHWRCRFYSDEILKNNDIIELYTKVTEAGFDIIKAQNLYNFDGERAYSLGQGE